MNIKLLILAAIISPRAKVPFLDAARWLGGVDYDPRQGDTFILATTAAIQSWLGVDANPGDALAARFPRLFA